MAGGGRDAATVEAATDHLGGELLGRAGRRHLHAHGVQVVARCDALLVADDDPIGGGRRHLTCIDSPGTSGVIRADSTVARVCPPLQGLASPGTASMLAPVVHMDCCSAVE